jgi:hypothetical protein
VTGEVRVVTSTRRTSFDEAWRDGDDTVTFWLPDRSAQLMVSTTPQPAGPMYLLDSVDAWVQDHPDVATAVETFEIPGGSSYGIDVAQANRGPLHTAH